MAEKNRWMKDNEGKEENRPMLQSRLPTEGSWESLQICLDVIAIMTIGFSLLWIVLGIESSWKGYSLIRPADNWERFLTIECANLTRKHKSWKIKTKLFQKSITFQRQKPNGLKWLRYQSRDSNPKSKNIQGSQRGAKHEEMKEVNLRYG